MPSGEAVLRVPPFLFDEPGRDLGFSLEAVVGSFSDGAMFVFDHDLRFLALGGDSLEEMGMPREGVVGRTLWDCFPYQLCAELEPSCRSALAGFTSAVDRVWNDRTFRLRLGPLRQGKQVLGGLGYVVDVTELHSAQTERRASEEHFRLAFDNAPIGMALVDLDGRFTLVNEALCRITGHTSEWLTGRPCAEITHPHDLGADDERVAELLAGVRSHYAMEKRYRTADGDWIWVLLSASIVRREDGTPLHFIAQIQDIDERVLAAQDMDRVHAALTEANHFQEAVLAATPDIISVTDVVQNTNVWTNLQVAGALGYTPEQLRQMGADLYATLLPEPDLATFLEAVENTKRVPDGQVVETRFRARHADGGFRWLERRMTPFHRDSEGQVVQILSVTSDVTSSEELQQQLAHTALHDGLTGLPNRTLVSDRLKQALLQVSRRGAVAVLFVDLDGFKRINDSFGHAAGDHVLRTVADRLVAAVRPGETVGRMGGDEFVVLLTDERDVQSLALSVAERLEALLAEPISHGGAEFSVTASIGIAVADAGSDPDTVLRDSDTAMFRAKQRGKNGHVMFHDDYHLDAVDQARIEALLRSALVRGGLEVHYQPVVCSRTGEVVSVEALMRVPDGSGTAYVDTARAIAVAEQTGLVGALGERLMFDACAQMVAWRQRPALANLNLAVNVSAPEIAKPALFERIVDVLERTGLPATALTLELTETVLLDAAHSTLEDLSKLRELGVGIAIDDFGTGYASLRYVSELPVTCVKVDHSFTRRMLVDPTSQSLVRATIRLAEDLGLRCVVEGVETCAHREALPVGSHIGYQGFLFARPAPAEELFVDEVSVS